MSEFLCKFGRKCAKALANTFCHTAFENHLEVVVLVSKVRHMLFSNSFDKRDEG